MSCKGPFQMRAFHRSVLIAFQSPVPKILTDLSRNQPFCSFQSEMHAFH